MRNVSRLCDSKIIDSKRLCVRAFFFFFLFVCLFCFFKPGVFSVELFWKSFALKKQVWERTLFSPGPWNISLRARHPMPACCWHIDWRTLACLRTAPCNQPTVSPPYLHLSFPPYIFNLSLEGSSQPRVGVGAVKKEVAGGISVTQFKPCGHQLSSREGLSSMHCTSATRHVETRMLFILYVVSRQ